MIDDIDRKILRELQGDARASYSEIGRRVGLTTPAVIERIRKLEDAGILTGYRAEIDPAKIGMPITAFIRMSITGVDYSHIIQVAEESTEILECHRGTGGDSFIMRVVVESVEHLQEVALDVLLVGFEFVPSRYSSRLFGRQNPLRALPRPFSLL